MARKTKEQKLKEELQVAQNRTVQLERRLEKLQPVEQFVEWLVEEIERAVENGGY